MTVYQLQISEPWDFIHPNGSNSFKVFGVGIIPGPDKRNWSKEFFLVTAEEPFEMDGEQVSQMICSPRYEGDTIQSLVGSGCTVGIARVKPQYYLDGSSKVNPDAVVYCAIGSIRIT